MTIEDRLEVLEKEIKRTKHLNRWLFGAVLLIVTIGIIGAAPLHQMKEIRANNFILEDENGNTRAGLCMKDGEPGLVLCDLNGKPLALLATEKGEPVFSLSDDNGSVRVGMTVHNFVLFNEKGKTIWTAP